jgi:alginate O-acetyltransferase complex protein AlgI
MESVVKASTPATLEVGDRGVSRLIAPSHDEVDPRATFAKPNVARFIALATQLTIITCAFVFLRLEEPIFIVMMIVVTVGFAIHYWLPFRLKETFLVILSLGSAFVLLDPVSASMIIVTGFAIFGIITSKMSYWTRVGSVVALAAIFVGFRTLGLGSSTIPDAFWPIVGSIFMFRLIVYLYDLRHSKLKPGLREYLSYFFILPNYYFLLFPVIDYQTMRRSYFQRDIHEVAQVGVTWIVRGLIQLMLYRLIYQYRLVWSPEEITTLPSLIREMIVIYLLYLRVSGSFHIIIGVMHLFGYNLPESHRNWALASSITDFWRRINIYWKDFMVKIVYLPVYFRLRRFGDARAQVIATIVVFVATWLLHSYQFYWLLGESLFTVPDTTFWAVLGGLVVVSTVRDRQRSRNKATLATRQSKVGSVLRVIGTFSLITVLWSLWNTPSLGEWLDIIIWWRIGW